MATKKQKQGLGLPQLNKPLMCKVVKYIEKHLDRFDMGTWVTLDGSVNSEEKLRKQDTLEEGFCGTKACFAGWTAMLTLPTTTTVNLLRSCVVSGEPGRYLTVSDHARDQLGLTDSEARRLFVGDAVDIATPKAQLKEVKRILNRILEERGESERFKV